VARRLWRPRAFDGAELERIARALGGRRSGDGWLCRCPAHDDRDPSLSLGIGADGRLLAHCFAGCDFVAVVAALRERGLLGDDGGSGERRCAARERHERWLEARRADLARRLELARQIWDNARPVERGDAVDRYLRGRGLRPAGACWPDVLRAGEDGVGPVMVAKAERWPFDSVASVQVTRLTRAGEKRGVKAPRQTFGIGRGAGVAVVRWTGAQKAVVVVEGVEDGLAVAMWSRDVAVVASLGASAAASLALPARSPVVLALDGDDAGREAAEKARRCLECSGHAVSVARLPDGTDPAALLAQKKWPGRAGPGLVPWGRLRDAQ
jgi:hypothetical protein